MKVEFIVPDMSCDHCVRTITRAVQACAPHAQVQAVTATHRVTVDNIEDPAAIERAISEAGYSPRAAQ